MDQGLKTQPQRTPEQWQEIKALFAAAYELPPSQRAVFLAELRASNPAHAVEVESLLHAHVEAGTVLEHPGYAHFQFSEDDDRDPWIGRKIGPYQAIARIGQGGMGAVYRAVR